MFSLAEWAEEGLMGHRIHICLKENVQKKKKKKMLNFFQVAVPSAFPLTMYESSICSTYMFSESSHVQK